MAKTEMLRDMHLANHRDTEARRFNNLYAHLGINQNSGAIQFLGQEFRSLIAVEVLQHNIAQIWEHQITLVLILKPLGEASSGAP